MEVMTAERSGERWAREAISSKWRTGTASTTIHPFSLPCIITHLFLLCLPPITFSLHPRASSLSSEPLPLRSDRGQHFSILQHTLCTLTDALTHTTSTLTSGCYSTSLIDLGNITARLTSRLTVCSDWKTYRLKPKSNSTTSETVMQNEHRPIWVITNIISQVQTFLVQYVKCPAHSASSG